MKICVRFTDGEQKIMFDSRKDVHSLEPAMAFGAKLGLALNYVADAFVEDGLAEAWVELDNGKRLPFAK